MNNYSIFLSQSFQAISASCSGLRIGTPAITTRGLKEDMMEPIVDMIDDVISAIDPVAKTAPDAKINAVREKVNMMMAEYPLFAW